MKKYAKLVIAFVVCTAFLLCPTIVNAKSILTLTASASGSKISVSGTAETGTLAGVVTVYDQAGTTMLDMESFPVNADSSFSFTLDASFSNGTYLVKVADYDGGAFAETNVVVSDSSNGSVPGNSMTAAPNNGNSKIPKTGDARHVVIWEVVFAVDVLAMAIVLYLYNKRKHS